MARGIALSDARYRLRAETGRSVKLSVQTDDLPRLDQILRRTQETLYDEYDWPHLRVLEKVQLANGQRYYDLPANVNVERIASMAAWWNGIPHPLERGILWPEYGSYDSRDDDRSDPPLRWDVRFTGTTEQLEVWPIPASDQAFLEIKGTRNLPPLVNEDDRLVLDDTLVVLFAAAEILMSEGAPEAEMKLRMAQDRMNRLRAQHAAGRKPVQMGQKNADRDISYGRATVRVN